MTAKIESIDFSLQKRQVQEAFELYLKEKSSALGILMTNGQAYQAGTNNKYEWLESQLTPKSWTINGQILAGTLDPSTPANLTFDSTTGLAVGDIVRFVDGTTLSPVGNLQVKIAAISSGTVATGTIYGGTTDITIPDNAVAKFISNPKAENEKSFTGDNDWEPGTEYNHFQIFRETVELSDTAMQSLMYGNPNTIVAQFKQGFYKFEQQMSEQMIYGRRIARTSTENGTFGGWDQYIDVADGNVIDASAGALTATLINDCIEDIRADGGEINTIACNTTQARKISAFNTSGNNPLIQRSETTTGSYVMRFVSDIPVAGGLVSNIIVDDKIANDRVYLLDINKVALVPYANRGINTKDASLPGQDGSTQLVRGEYTLVVKDGKYSHGVIKNLSL